MQSISDGLGSLGCELAKEALRMVDQIVEVLLVSVDN